MVEENPLVKMFSRALSIMAELSTAMTRAAPALAQNMLRIPVPQPTSNTVLPAKMDLLL